MWQGWFLDLASAAMLVSRQMMLVSMCLFIHGFLFVGGLILSQANLAHNTVNALVIGFFFVYYVVGFKHWSFVLTKTVPMTKQGEEMLRSELKRLIAEERPRISKEIGAAREHGDLKENAEYHAAKEQQGLTEARIAYIQDRLKHAYVVDVSQIKETSKVLFGAQVTLLNSDTEKQLVLTIVGEEEADLKQAKLSINAPLASACIGKHVGDEPEVNTPSGTIVYEIEKVVYQ